MRSPLFALWRNADVPTLLAPWRGQPVPSVAELASVQGALDAGRRALPGDVITSIVFPGNEDGSPHHYVLWAKGPRRSPIERRMRELEQDISADLTAD